MRHTAGSSAITALGLLLCLGGCQSYDKGGHEWTGPSATEQAAIVAAGSVVGGPIGGAIATGGCVLLGIIASITNAKAKAARAEKQAADQAWSEAAATYSPAPPRVPVVGTVKADGTVTG